MSFRELPVIRPELKDLGARLGEERLREILRRFYAKMSKDLLIGFFFEGHDLDAIADQQAAFLMRAMGLRTSYSGKPPAEAHTKLAPILPGHFDRRLVLLDETLREAGIKEHDRHLWLGFENAFRDGIVKEG